MKGVRVTAVADPDAAARRRAQRLVPRAATVMSAEELVARDDVDAVVVCSPSACHADHAVLALESGRHLYLEKPLAIGIEDGRRIVEVARRSNVTAAIGFNWRYQPLVQRAYELLRSGAIGEVREAQTTFCESWCRLAVLEASSRVGRRRRPRPGLAPRRSPALAPGRGGREHERDDLVARERARRGGVAPRAHGRSTGAFVALVPRRPDRPPPATRHERNSPGRPLSPAAPGRSSAARARPKDSQAGACAASCSHAASPRGGGHSTPGSQPSGAPTSSCRRSRTGCAASKSYWLPRTPPRRAAASSSPVTRSDAGLVRHRLALDRRRRRVVRVPGGSWSSSRRRRRASAHEHGRKR